ncbi:MAG: DnaJ domain-containing protein [Alphaproteobacteria bacterium]|nr:DnaJ domain-containing protein [Alphaproteobacteria bacterium]
MRNTIKEKDAALYGLDRPVKLKACDCPGCSEAGLYRAPKSRAQLNDYYWFCLIHARQYNESWDYFAGMSETEIEEHIRFDTCWQRGTAPPAGARPAGGWRAAEDNLRANVKREFFAEDDDTFASAFSPREPRSKGDELPATIAAALTVLELKAPVTLDTIKAQYKVLVKKHHPDTNGGSKQAEEKFKVINQAFAVLKTSYGAPADE